MNWFRNSRFYADGLPGVGLLFLRLWMGYAMAMHGMGKIGNPFGWMDRPDHPSGVPAILQALAAASEFFGGIALAFGILTPLAALAVMSVMFVATLSFFTNDVTPTYFINMGPKVPGDNAEAPFVYFIFALTLFLTGPGLLSIDAFLFGRKRAVALAPGSANTPPASPPPAVKTG